MTGSSRMVQRDREAPARQGDFAHEGINSFITAFDRRVTAGVLIVYWSMGIGTCSNAF
jgi:hypothetical protein